MIGIQIINMMISDFILELGRGRNTVSPQRPLSSFSLSFSSCHMTDDQQMEFDQLSWECTNIFDNLTPH